MIMETMTCSMCGYEFDPEDNQSCKSCPVQKSCHLFCCPNCGFETVSVQQSAIARFAARILNQQQQSATFGKISLAGVSPGKTARIVDFDPAIPHNRKAQLHAYGINPGNSVRILQQSPITIIQIDHTEIALERILANSIIVE